MGWLEDEKARLGITTSNNKTKIKTESNWLENEKKRLSIGDNNAPIAQNKEAAFIPTISPNFKEGGEIRNETWKDKVGGFLDKATTAIKLPKTALSESTVVPSMIHKAINPEGYKEDMESLDKHPVIKTAGMVAGSLIPAIGIEKGLVQAARYGFNALKATPKLASSLNTAVKLGEGIGATTKLAGRAVAGSAGYGALEGLGEGFNNDKSVGETLDAIKNKAYNYGVMGGTATGLLGGAANLYKNTAGFNKGIEKVGQQVDNFQFPQLRDLRESTKPILNNRASEFSPLRRDLFPNNRTQANLPNTRSNLSPLNSQSNINPPLINNNALNPATIQNTANNGDFRVVSGQKQNTDSIFQKTKQKFSDIYDSWVNNENMLTKFDKTSGDKKLTVSKTAMNAKKVNSTVEYIITKDLVNKDGIKVGEGLQKIIKDIPKNKTGDFEQYLLHKHNIDRVREGKVLDSSIDTAASVNKIAAYEQANPEFANLSKRINDFQTKFSQEWSVNSGLSKQQLMDDLRVKYPNYINSSREFSELEKGFNNVSSRAGFVDQSSGIKTATGSDRDIVSPLENIMNMVNRTVRSAKKNEVAQRILEKVQQNPQAVSKYAEILPPNYTGKLDLDNIVTVKVNGDDVYMKINDKRFLDTINKSADLPQSEGLEKVNSLFKGLITQYNPIFAVRNIARDIPTSYIYGSENNPLKFGRDLLKAGKEIITKGPQSKQYDALGGGGSNFFSPSESTAYVDGILNPKTGLKSIPKKILKGVESFNNFTEKVPRLAEFQRTLKKGGTVQDALYNAGETTVNFARGGDKAKALDKKYVPYLNASIQGLDRFARGVKANPLGFAGKGLTIITAPTVATEVWNRTVDPEGYKNLDNRTKDNYFVFAQGDGKFLKLPKSRELAVIFSSLFQRLYRAANGEDGNTKESFKGFGNTVATNFTPVNPLESNIYSPAINILTGGNKDFANRDIVPQYMKNLSPNMQYDEKTSEIAKWLGNAATKIPLLEGGLSPKQIDYIIRSYSGVIGQMGLPATTKNNSSLLKPITSQFKSDSTYSNQNISDFYDNIDKLTKAASDRNIKENIPTGLLTPEERRRGLFTKQADRISKLRKHVKEGTDEEKRQAQKEISALSKLMNESLK